MLDGEKYVDKNRGKLKEYGISTHDHLNYFSRNGTKTYGLTVLKALCKYYGYSLKSKVKSAFTNGNRQTSRYYCIVKEENESDDSNHK